MLCTWEISAGGHCQQVPLAQLEPVKCTCSISNQGVRMSALLEVVLGIAHRQTLFKKTVRVALELE